jgi:hypothetical protein
MHAARDKPSVTPDVQEIALPVLLVYVTDY